MKNIILLFLVFISLKDSFAGPLDNKSLTLIEYKYRGRKYSNTVRCSSAHANLSTCDKIVFSENTINKKIGKVRSYRSYTITKQQFFDSLNEFSKEYMTLTIPLNSTVMGGVGCYRFDQDVIPHTWIPCLILLGVPVGLSLDIAGLPVYGGIFIYRAIYKRIRVIKNIRNLIDNKKFKTIKPKRVSALYERGFNMMLLSDIVSDKASL